MSWAAIITAVLSFLGPLIADWLKKCGEERAQKAAEKLPDASTFASEHEARDALFDQMIADLPPHARIRRAMLRRCKAVSAKCGVTSQGVATAMSAEDAEELADLAAE